MAETADAVVVSAGFALEPGRFASTFTANGRTVRPSSATGAPDQQHGLDLTPAPADAARGIFAPGMTPVSRVRPPTERRIALAGSRPRQQRRPGASRPEKEDAARRRVSRDEAAQILRKAVGTEKSGK